MGFFYILLYLFSQNWIVTFYIEVIGMSQTRGEGGIQDKGNGVGGKRGVETHKEGVSWRKELLVAWYFGI